MATLSHARQTAELTKQSAKAIKEAKFREIEMAEKFQAIIKCISNAANSGLFSCEVAISKRDLDGFKALLENREYMILPYSNENNETNIYLVSWLYSSN